MVCIEYLWQEWAFHQPVVLAKKSSLVFKNVSESLRKLRLIVYLKVKMNHLMQNLCGVIFKWREFQFQWRVWNGELYKHVLLRCFTLNKHNLLNFSWYVIRVFHCAWVLTDAVMDTSSLICACTDIIQLCGMVYWTGVRIFFKYVV